MSIPERIAKIYDRKLFALTPLEIEEEKLFFKEFSSKTIAKNTILIIEPNNCHSECLPTYVNYFLEEGFNVDLFISEKNINENAFVNCHFDKNKFRLFTFKKPFAQPEFFEFLNQYKYIFLASLTFFGPINENYGYYAKLLKENYIEKYKKTNLFLISHEIDFTEKTVEIEEYFQDKTFVLRPNVIKNSMNKALPYIVPSYFGEIDIQHNKKEHYAKFLCIGGTYKKNLRNFETLLESIKKLSKNYSKHFEIIYIGNPDEDFKNKVKEENLKINFTGRINFADMYNHVLNSDFILFNIDKNSVEYERYLTKKISGSYSLSLGFLRPGIIDERLADTYSLKEGAITYNNENLYEAMEKAIKISSTDYIKLVSYLNKLNQNLKNQSIKNIKEYFYA